MVGKVVWWHKKQELFSLRGDRQLSEVDLPRTAWFKPGQDLSFELVSLILREKFFSITEKKQTRNLTILWGKSKDFNILLANILAMFVNYI